MKKTIKLTEAQEAVQTFSQYIRYGTASLYSQLRADEKPITRGEFYNMMNHLEYVLNKLSKLPLTSK